jgi:uncharacterized protein (DUF2141 family)
MAPPERRWRRLATAAVLVVPPLPAGASELRVTVEGIRSAHGTILIGLYDTAESFDKAVEASDKEGFLIDPDRFGAVALRANAAMKSAVVFSNLEPGRYAAVAFHDENGNGKLDRNLLGIPAEPYGFSNNVNGFLSPPSFDDAIMVLGHGDSNCPHQADLPLNPDPPLDPYGPAAVLQVCAIAPRGL